MTKRFLSVVLAAVLCVSMSFVAFAATDRNYVVDELDILSPSEIEELSAYADGVYEKCGVGMFFAYLRADDLSDMDVTAIVGEMQDYVFMAENETNWYLHTAGKGTALSEDDLRAAYDGNETYVGGIYAFFEKAASWYGCAAPDDGDAEIPTIGAIGDGEEAAADDTVEDHLFVTDVAALLTAPEYTDLLAQLKAVSSKHGMQVSVVTLPSMDGSDIDEVVGTLYDAQGYGYGADHSGVLLLVSMDPREFRILSNGEAAGAIGTDAIDDITDEIRPSLSEGDYAEAFTVYADQCEYYINGYLNGFDFEYGKWIMIAVGIGLAAGLIVALVFKAQLKSVRKQNRANVYVREGSMQLTQAGDFFMYRTVTRRAKPKSNSSSSSSGSRNVGGGSF